MSAALLPCLSTTYDGTGGEVLITFTPDSTVIGRHDLPTRRRIAESLNPGQPRNAEILRALYEHAEKDTVACSSVFYAACDDALEQLTKTAQAREVSALNAQSLSHFREVERIVTQHAAEIAELKAQLAEAKRPPPTLEPRGRTTRKGARK